MRKIEKEMRAAIATARNWSKDNTLVSNDGMNTNVFLHGNHIASVRKADGVLVVNIDTLRRWPTMTTRSRLRALGAHLVSSKGKLYLDNVEV